MPHRSVKSCYKLVILVRHGQYETAAATADAKVLTERGWEQARRAGKRLRELGLNIDCVVHSDMIRARQTAAAILSELDQVKLAETGILELTNSPQIANTSEAVKKAATTALQPSPLRSPNFSLLESPSIAEGPPPIDPTPYSYKRLQNYTPEELKDRSFHKYRIETSFEQHIHRCPISEAGQRALRGPLACHSMGSLGCACSRSLQNMPMEVILVVGHANVFRYWLCRALQLPPEAWLRVSLPHGSFTELLVEQTQASPDAPIECAVTSLRIGDDGHLPVELQSR